MKSFQAVILAAILAAASADNEPVASPTFFKQELAEYEHQLRNLQSFNTGPLNVPSFSVPASVKKATKEPTSTSYSYSASMSYGGKGGKSGGGKGGKSGSSGGSGKGGKSGSKGGKSDSYSYSTSMSYSSGKGGKSGSGYGSSKGDKLLGGVTIASSGVLPNIHAVLLPKKSGK